VNKKISDPSIFLLLGFGVGLVCLGVQQLMPTKPELIAAATYGTLVSAIAEFVGGTWAFARGDTYLGAIGSTFGAWLFGYYYMVTAGVAAKIYHPQSAGLYCFALIIPVALLAIPSIKLKLKAFTGVFVGLILVLLFLGLAGMPIGGTNTWARLGGVFALVTAALLWWSAFGAIKGLLAQMMAPPPAE
jgi:succinate-acetate transporter protein